MRAPSIRQITLLFFLVSLGGHADAARADGDLNKVKHLIVVMQENHSFDNYFGVLPYVPGGPYHAGPCHQNDHGCVDGLDCKKHGSTLECRNWNRDADARGTLRKVFSFHSANYCPGPDLNHDWPGTHQEANFHNPTKTLRQSPNDGFVRVNDATSQPDSGGETPTDDDTMGYYDQTDLPFYYGLAQTFAIGDRYFSSVLGPTFPNRAYQLAGTSFGHLTTFEIVPPLVPPPGGYKPITGTILDLLDRRGVGWTNFFSDAPTTGIFRGVDPAHLVPVELFPLFTGSQACGLPPVSFVDPALGFQDPTIENDEHPPTDIRKGQFFVSGIVNAIRNSACWKDSVIFFTYDEHGGFYDHVAPPRAPQGGALNPDGIDPGQCADASAPGSEQPGAGAQCAVSRVDAKALCPDFTPTGPYPSSCPNFDQLGFRVPFVAVSPFSKPHYVSHVVADHASMLAFMEKRFLRDATGAQPHLTLRDLEASTLEDLFDFDGAPSMNASVSTAPVPLPNDPGCPFVPVVP
ncbi:MAG TPA: alkaline phosphatase family protein [Myxococcales bacterium]|nr:alkaline phosphatase family protein [Myxococcales bacterium]